jgi:parallel beta-helix repeat protein
MGINRRHSILVSVLIVFGAVPVLVINSASAVTCSGVQLKSGMSISSVVNGKPSGTTFCLAPGTYNVTSTINPRDGDTFVGTGTSRGSTLLKTTSIQIIFDGKDNRNITFRHFAISGAVNRCPGTNCGATGRALSGGINVRVEDMHLFSNGTNGIGGMGPGLVVNNSEIDHNGFKVGDWVSDGIKAVNPFTVTGSYIHDNRNSGIHCDLQCGTFTVANNTVTNNTGMGIMMEISPGTGSIHGNIVRNNNTSNTPGKGGIGIIDSKNVDVYGNTVDGNLVYGIRAYTDVRINCGFPSATCGYALANVKIHDNKLTDPLVGCDANGVTCSSNAYATAATH